MPTGLFVVAEIDEAKRIAKQFWAEELDGYVELPGMALIDIVTLGMIVGMESEAAVALLQGSGRVSSGTALQISEELRSKLATIPPKGIKDLAEKWAESEEFRGLIPSSILATFLRKLRAMAKESQESSKPLLFLNF